MTRISDGAIARAKHLYETTSLSVQEIHNNSVDFLGEEVSLATLHAKQAEQGWRKEYAVTDRDMEMLQQLEEVLGRFLEPEVRNDLNIRQVSSLVNSFERLQNIKQKLRTASKVSDSRGERPVVGRTKIVPWF